MTGSPAHRSARAAAAARLACAAAVCLLALACSEADAPGEAPEGFPELLAWAEQELGRAPGEAPLPLDPVLPEPRWPVIQLDAQLARAQVSSDWTPRPSDSNPVLEFGPIRSDRPGGRLRVVLYEGGFAMEFGGVRIPSEEIGSIVIEIRQPAGTYFDLGWGRAGQIRVPVPSNDREWMLRVETDGLAEWRGILRRFWLQFPEESDEPVEIRSIRFQPRIDSFPEAAGLRRVSLGRERRSAIYLHPGTEVRLPELALPPAARLQVGLGRVDDASGRGPVAAALRFELAVEREGERRSLLVRELEREEGWLELEVPLDEWAEKSATLVLRASGAEGAVALWATPVVYQPVPDPPLVILYLIDTLGAAHVSHHGYGRPTTPHLQRLAEEGVWFSDMLANSPRTLESVADLMLSLPASRHGVHQLSVAADPALVALPEVLRAAGFATASFGTNVNAGPRQNMDQGFDYFLDRISYWWEGEANRTVPIEAVLDWLAAHADRPSMLYIHTAEPHAPYRPPEEYAGRFDDGYQGPIDGSFDPTHGFQRATTPEEIAHVVALHDEEIAYADAMLGTFVAALADAGLEGRTHLFVTADHGEQFLEHGHWEHGEDLHAELTRIPLVIQSPVLGRRGRIDAGAQIYDLMPTILGLFDLPQPYPLAGESLLPLLRGDSTSLVRQMRFASNHTHQSHGVIERAVVESGRWKLMYRYRRKDGSVAPFALYDLGEDPRERHDVLDAHRDVARRLIEELIQEHRRQRPFTRGASAYHLHMSPEQLESLRSLGYID